ncbi:MAG: serine/threonine protein kinase, CMGC, CDC2/CDK sub [Claussenomyces sp. TS43310]|nr:MAG: serine/threonine protein kinase, CMGC, CDC2/CDK sub [Claussenomyces sp. TS43310]
MATAAAQQPSPGRNGLTPQADEARGGQGQRPVKAFAGCSRITDYEVLGKLGEGTFGEVHRAKSRKTGAVVALKKILMHNEKDGFPITALREIKLLKLLSHPNILRLEEMAVEHAQKSNDKRKRAIMYMVTPYMDHDLSGLLENPNVHFTEPQVKCYMLQLLEGTRYLHDQHILHRDMKAANLLINNKGILQIADFGLARHYDEPVPQAGYGGGEARRDYTTLVVTRWYRPPELLMHLRKYTTAIDLWGVGCVFGEMLIGRPILAGDSDPKQLDIIFDLMGSPTEENMPGWRSLPGAEGLTPRPRPSTISQRFREYGSGAISLLNELLKLDWRRRINAIDALKHPYFRNAPLPAEASDLPSFEESHELDRRKFRGQKAAPPPAPKGGTVGMGPSNGWSGEGGGGNAGYGNGDGYGMNRHNGNRYQGPPPLGYRNGGPPPPHNERRPAWQRDSRPESRLPPDTRLPPRPPPVDYAGPSWGGSTDGSRSDQYRDRGPPRSRGGGSGSIGGGGGRDVDTYIPSYGPDSGRGRDDRRRWDDRRHDREHNRLDYDDRGRNGRTRSRSRSPVRDRDRERVREREPVDRDRDYRR